MRLIPGKTKVHVELFRGVTLGDILICAIALVMLVFVVISNLPWKIGICIAVAILAGMLLFRMDDQPNYIYLLHILSFFGYHRRFRRLDRDEKLIAAAEAGEAEGTAEKTGEKGAGRGVKKAAKTGKKEEKAAKKAEAKAKVREKRREDKLLKSRRTPEEVKQTILARRQAAAEGAGQNGGDAAPRMTEAERKRLYKEEEKTLKSKTATEEEKAEILARRKERSRESMRRMAELRDRETVRRPMEEIIPFTGIRDGFIEYLGRSYYGAVLEIDPVEFRFFSQHRRDNSIENCLGRVLRSIHSGYSANIVKLERPIVYDKYLDREYDKLDKLRASYENGILTEEELRSRVEIEYDRINELRSYCDGSRVIVPFYYLALFESDKRQLENQIRDAEQLLRNGELTVRRLDDKGLAVFLKYTNQIDFDEHDVDRVRPEDLHLWAQPTTVDIHVRNVQINHIVTHNFRVVNYPTVVGDAWLAGVMSMPGTKVVVKCRLMDRTKAIRNIDRSLQELRGQWSATSIDSRRLEIETHLNSLQELLSTLQSDSEALLECNVYVSAYDIVSTRNNPRIPQPEASELPTMNEMKKNIRRAWQESGFRLNNMEFDQVQAFIGSQVSAFDPLAKEGRGISSNTVAACYPWIYAHISDEGGVKLGESDGVPVFINFFRRDSERVNSNMVIVGKSGSGKSYATKSLLANLAAEDAKIFILDPENEYTELAGNLHGQIINLGNAQYGRLNPFHIITALDDDSSEGGPSGSYATHLQFLEEFFKQIMPDCEKDALEYLNTLVDHMYLTRDITAETDLSRLRPEDYPIFDDLYDQVLQEFQSSDNPFTRDLLRTLMNYIAKFSSGGRNANIWNGPSTVTTDENFTVFNFQSMLANRNQTIANAQMMLVLKYIDNEIIKNREYNTRFRASRKIVVVIDEAHVFIDAKYPIALDFMFQLAKRIRKYNGMQIVITQNIKDFVGSEELARKSTAIINACQYSFIFALAPNDISDLVTLYEKAGGINETEQEQIVQAPRGQAFVVMSPTSRSTFQISTAPGITEMFEEREYHSRYFSGEEGADNWEEFIGDSRGLRDEALGDRDAGRAPAYEPEAEQEEPGERRRVIFNEFDEDEYEAFARQSAPETESSGGVTFNILEDEPEEEYSVSFPETGGDYPQAQEQPELFPPAGGEAGGSETLAIFGMIASALDRMASAAERGGSVPAQTPAAYPAPQEGELPPVPEEPGQVFPAQSPAGQPAAPADPATAALEARLREMEAELDRLRAERELLRSASAAAAAERETAPDVGPDDTPEAETWPEELGPFDGLDDDAPAEEEDGALVDLFEARLDLDGDGDTGEDTSDAAGPGDGDEYDEDEYDEDEYDEDEDDEDEDEDEDGYDEDESEEGDEDESEEGDEDESDEDFMSSFCSFASSLMNMTVFERMRANGRDTMEISFEDLAAEARAQSERRRGSREYTDGGPAEGGSV